jgi:hypothetical protein
MAPTGSSVASIVELAGVALWLGAAILFAAVVAPALFAVLPSRALAGDVVARVLPAILYSGIALSIFAGAREASRGTRLRAIAAFVMGAMCVYALVVGRQIDRLRETIGGPVDVLSADDPRRIQFGRLHGFSVLLLGVAMLAALTLSVALGRRVAGRGSDS